MSDLLLIKSFVELERRIQIEAEANIHYMEDMNEKNPPYLFLWKDHPISRGKSIKTFDKEEEVLISQPVTDFIIRPH